jgi:hypothetical protein
MTTGLTRPGGWAFGELLTSAQVEALDASQARGVDGTGGGTYTPSVKIIINGQGLQVNSLTVTGTLSLLGNTTIGNAPSDALSVLATSTFSAPVTLNDALTANDTVDFFADATVHTSALFTVGGSSSIGNDSSKNLTVGATSTFNAPITANDNVEVWGDLTCHSATTTNLAGDVTIGLNSTKSLVVESGADFNAGATLSALIVNGESAFNGATALGSSTSDPIDVPGTMNLHNALAYSFNGRVPSRPILATDADHSYAVSDGNEVIFADLQADRTLTLSKTGAKDGDSWDIGVPNHGGGTGAKLTISDGQFTVCFIRPFAGAFAYAKLRYVSGAWRVLYQTG